MSRVLVEISVLLLIVFNNSRMYLSKEAQKNSHYFRRLGETRKHHLLSVARPIVMVSSYLISDTQDLFHKIAKK